MTDHAAKVSSGLGDHEIHVSSERYRWAMYTSWCRPPIHWMTAYRGAIIDDPAEPSVRERHRGCSAKKRYRINRMWRDADLEPPLKPARRSKGWRQHVRRCKAAVIAQSPWTAAVHCPLYKIVAKICRSGGQWCVTVPPYHPGKH